MCHPDKKKPLAKAHNVESKHSVTIFQSEVRFAQEEKTHPTKTLKPPGRKKGLGLSRRIVENKRDKNAMTVAAICHGRHLIKSTSRTSFFERPDTSLQGQKRVSPTLI